MRVAAAPLPSGTVTFVLADVEGSVRLWECQPDAMAAATARFGTLISEQVERHHGARPEEQGEGDSFVAAFAVAHEAMAFIVALQRLLQSEPWAMSLPLRVRAALHTGAAQLRGDGNYMGPTVNRCARIRALAHGGQVLLSGATSALVADEMGDGFSLRDLGLHTLRDLDRPEHLFQLVHPDLADRFPPLRDERESVRLPASLTTFVAREGEMKTVAELLHRERLVTLTGAGGSGKTRLALESARHHADQFAGGVAWADAAPIADGALLTSCVAGALGVREVPSEALIDTVVREVADQHALLVIDNCEHVIDHAARLVERLLGDCPRLHILATSREPVGVSGETAMRVPSLADDAAVQLFIDRARAASAGFEVTPESEDAVTEVCQRLDGIPLAIELAAARVRVLTPEQIAAGLADRFRLLTGGSRTALPRQRTLEASVDWSYRLLSDSERVLLDRLSVFAGGFTLEAVRRVCSDDVLSEASLLDLLSALVDKSLVDVEVERRADESRYRVLETIGNFARQRLADRPDVETVRDRHLHHFLELAEEAGPRIEQGHEVASLDRLEADLDNLRAAFEWADQRGESQLLLRLAAGLWLFHEVRCRFEEGLSWLRTALAASTEPTTVRAAALHGLGDISVFTMDMETVAMAGQELVAIGEHLANSVIVARGMALLGWAACFGAYRDTAWVIEALGDVVASFHENEDPWLYVDANHAVAVAYLNEGDLRAAATAAERGLASARRSGNVASLQRSLYWRGWIHNLAGEVDDGEAYLVRAIELADELDDTFVRAVCFASTGYGRFLRGDAVGAEDDATTAIALGDRYGNPFAFVLGSLTLAVSLAARGDDDRAWSVLEAARPVVEQFSMTWVVQALSEGTSALVEGRRGDLAAARARLDAAAGVVEARPYARGFVALHRGWVERLAGDDAAAESAFSDAAEASAAAGARADAATALDELGVSAARREQFERAARLFGAADAERATLAVTRLQPAGLPGRDAELAATRAALGDEGFATGIEAGRDMSLVEAVRLALRGKGGRRGPSSGWGSLTPTELEVVRLVREGLTNPVIAAKLVITSGTVKVHLSHIFTKVGVRSRAELAAEAARRMVAS